MMSDLEDIAAAAGITIIDTKTGDDVAEKDRETENKYVANKILSDEFLTTKQVHEWDDKFCNRYTMSDPDYATTVETADTLNQPPCLTGFNCFRHRDGSRNWNRDRRNNDGDGRYNNRGNPRSNWNRHGGDDGGDRDREDDRSQHNLQNYGDYQRRGHWNQHSTDDRGHSNWGYDGYQNRGNSNYENRRNFSYDQRKPQ